MNLRPNTNYSSPRQMERAELVSVFSVPEIRRMEEHETENNWIDVRSVSHISNMI